MPTVEEARKRFTAGPSLVLNQYYRLNAGDASFYGLDLFRAKYQIGLAQLADVLLTEETILLAEPVLGLQQIFDCFGPERAMELLRTGRILAGIGDLKSFDELLAHVLSPTTGAVTRGIVFGDNWSQSIPNFIETANQSCVIDPDERYEGLFATARDEILATWEPLLLNQANMPDFLSALIGAPFFYGRVAAGQPPGEAGRELLRGYAALLANGLLLGANKSIHDFESQRILTALRVKSKAPPSFVGTKELLQFENLPKPGSLVMSGQWDAGDVYQCIMSDSATQLRNWLMQKRFIGGNFATEYQGTVDALPRRELWSRTVRFLAVSGLSIAIAHVLTSYPIIADLLGLGVGSVDQFFLDSAFAPWHPRIWVDEYAQHIRHALSHP